MDKNTKNKNLLIALFVIVCLFIISLKNNAIKVEAAEEEGFKVKYYKDEGLTQEIQSDSKLKEGDYYIKIDKKGKIVSSVNISIDAEGVLNDVNNAKASQIDTNGFKYKRTISYDEDAKGIEPEKILINDSDVLDKENSIYYTDTILPKLKLESHTNGNVDTYKLISDESLSYIKIELSSDIYAILYKGMYKSSFSGDCYGWHMKAKKGWITLTNIDIFKDKNNFSLYLGDASITITKNEDDSEFTIDMTGDIAEQVRKQKSVPLLVRDDAENELEREFKIPVSLKKELGIFEFKKYIVRDSGIYAEYELKNSKGEAVDLKELVEIKRKLKEGISFETVQDFILPIQDKGDFVYSILFKDVEYTAEISSQGVIDVSINKTGNAKEIDGNIYYEYIVPGIDFTDITLYQFGEENEEILINDLNLYFNQEKEGFFIYYFKKLDDWYKFTINFEKDIVPAPSLKSFSFNLNKENKIFYSFEIASTGHKDIYVNKAILNIYDKDNNIILNDAKQGSFEKDIPYVFELDSSKLEKGKTYHYSITLLNASKTYESDKTYFTTKPGDVSNINITKIDTNKIKLSFDKGEGSDGTIILNKDRNVVYRGSETSFEYNLSKEDTFLYFISFKDMDKTDLLGFNEKETDVKSYFEEVALITLPLIETKEAFNITKTKATLKGNLKDSGNSKNVSLSFEYGKESGIYENTEEADLSFEATLNNLTSETTYYYRAKACNEKGCSFGKELNFKTDILIEAPALKNTFFEETKDRFIVSFEIASTGHKDIYVNKAILNIYDKDNNIILNDAKQGSFEKDIPYVFELDSSKLEKGKTYHYSITLLNASKTYESDKTYFTTKPGDVSNINITKIDTNKIKLSFDKGEGSDGTIILNKDRNVVYRGSETSFEYNLSKEDTFLYFISFKDMDKTDLLGFNEKETDVKSYFEEVALITLPLIETKEAFNITKTKATLKGNLKDSGNSKNVSLSFEYGKESGIYENTEEADLSFEATLNNLTSETTYYYRAKACNEKGCSFGKELNFKTDILIEAPALKNTFFEETKDRFIVSFEIASTGHKDIYVNKAILNIYDKDNNIILNDAKQGSFEKDIPYVFELDSSKLEKGKTYHYSITLLNASKTYESDKTYFTTKPGDVSNINITKIDTNKIKLSFDKGEGSDGTIILNKDRNVVYRGSETSFEYNLSKEDTFLYFISFKDMDKTDLLGFNEKETDVKSYFEEVALINLPLIETKEAFNITKTKATLKGNLKDSGNSKNVSLSFEYGKESGIYENTEEADLSFEATLNNLTSETTYYYRAKACNEKGCSFGKELNFKTDILIEAPALKNTFFEETKDRFIVSFEIASTGHKDIYVNKAILNIYDKDNNIILNDAKQGSFEKDIPYVFELDSSKLEKGKTYHYSITLLNASKTYESDKTYFTTKPGDVSNINITKIDTNKIKLSFDKGEGSDGTIILNKDRNVVYRGSETSFEYNLSKEDTFLYFTSFKNIDGIDLLGFNEKEVEVKSYFEEVLEINFPSIETNEAFDITQTKATLKGNLKDSGNSKNVSLFFEYGKESSVYEYVKESDSSFETTLNDLTPETTYYFRAKACNERGCSYGEELSFKTSILIEAPVLKNTFFEETKDRSIISFEIASTGHKDISVNKITLNIFDENNELVLKDTKQGSFEKDTLYTFELNTSKLEKGKTYFYSIILENTSKTNESDKTYFVTKPGDVLNINIDKIDTNKIKLSFDKGQGSDGTFVFNKDRNVIYKGDKTSFEYNLSKEDTFLYFTSFKNIDGIDLLGFNEKEVEVKSYFEEVLPEGKDVFNNDYKDYPLRVNNITQNSNWSTSLTNVNPGDELKFSVYYHNTSNKIAKNGKIVLSLSQESGSDLVFTSKILADDFEEYTSNATISLNEAKNINLENTAKWYHNYDGSQYEIDDVNVNVSENTITFDLGDINSGYAPNDGYIIFSAKVEELNNFNADSRDYPLRVNNITQNSNWSTSLTNVNPGDELKFSVYYHNTSNKIAKNGKIVLSLSQESGSDLVFTSKILADDFEEYTSNATISLNEAKNINLENTAKWYHNYDGSQYEIDDVNVNVSENTITFDLGDINSGYAPNDGYIIFSAKVEELNNFNADSRDYPLRVNNITQNSNWSTSLTNVNPGDELKFSVYYHNTSNKIAKNGKIVLSLSQESGSDLVFTSKILADDFEEYTSNATISLNEAKNINLENTAKWYHNYDGSQYEIDDVNVNVSENTITFDLGDINSGYAPNDGYIIFSAKVEELNNFNADSRDYPLRVNNITQNSNWSTSLTNVNPGDELKFSVYYHNTSNKIAKNGKIVLSLSQESGSDLVFTSKILADDFEEYTSNATISLNEAKNINLENTAKWYHNYDGSQYEIDDVNVNVSENTITFDLGDINSGYAPNDGYVIFSAVAKGNANLKNEELYELTLKEIQEILNREMFLNLGNNDDLTIELLYGGESENYTNNLIFSLSELNEERLNTIDIQGKFYYKIKVCNLEECYYGKEHLL